jgi:hypothetical protein
LELNVAKTKELIFDFRRSKTRKTPVTIKNSPVEIAASYKYLGLVIDDKLSFKEHTERQLKKVNKRLYCIWSMVKLHVSPEIITLFFKATVPTVLMFACAAFYGLIPGYMKVDLDRPRRRCKRHLIDNENNDDIFNHRIYRLANNIIKDSGHPLNCEFKLLPSGRRYGLPKIRTNRFKNSFVPLAIKMINNYCYGTV